MLVVFAQLIRTTGGGSIAKQECDAEFLSMVPAATRDN